MRRTERSRESRGPRILNPIARRHTPQELDALLLAREQGVLERYRIRRAHRFMLPLDVKEVRPQLAEDIGDDWPGAVA